VLNNLEFDHADIFRDLADVQRTFFHLARIVPRNGWIILNGDDENLRALGPLDWTRVVRVGTGVKNDLRITDFSETAAGATFKLVWRAAPWTEVKWTQPGLFNARNAAMAACAAGLALFGEGRANPPAVAKAMAGGPDEPSSADGSSGRLALPTGSARVGDAALHLLKLDALARFRGVKRRQELLIDTPQLKVVEDFGHHPTALAETLVSFRARFPGHMIHAAFEPRSNTSRTKVMQAGFMRALALADEVYLGCVAQAQKLKEHERFDAEAVGQHLETQGVQAHAAATNAALLEKLVANTLPGDGPPQLVVFFTNGSFDGIIQGYVAAAKG